MRDVSSSDVFVGLAVQREYLDGGIQPCANSAALPRAVRQLMVLSRWSGQRMLSCVDVHRPHDIGDGFVGLGFDDAAPCSKMPSYCLLPKRTVVQSDNCLCVPLDLLEKHQQAVFVKVHKDPFTNPKLERLFTELPARRFVVFGAPLESSVRLLVLGLLRRSRRVLIVEDACGYFRQSEAAMTLRQLHVKGAEISSADTYVRDAVARLSQRPRRRRRSVA
jgi:Isochorismatase family